MRHSPWHMLQLLIRCSYIRMANKKCQELVQIIRYQLVQSHSTLELFQRQVTYLLRSTDSKNEGEPMHIESFKPVVRLLSLILLFGAAAGYGQTKFDMTTQLRQ